MSRGLALAAAGVLALALAAAGAWWLRPAWAQAALKKLPAAWRAQALAWRHGVNIDHSLVLRLPDGVQLHASLYRPRGVQGPLPTVLIRLPYGRKAFRPAWEAAVSFAREGYAVVVQDLRGTGDSTGELWPWRHAQEDGVATLDWIAAQPWSNGKVGTYGCSALGETQWPLARAGHPAHAAMVPSGSGGAVGSAAGRHGYFGLFEGGVFQLASGAGWFVDHGAARPGTPAAKSFDRAGWLKGLPVAELPARVRPGPSAYTAFLDEPLGSPAWQAWGYLADNDTVRVPALVMNTWGDQTVGDTLAYAEAARRAALPGAAPQRVVIAPGHHCDHAVWGQGTALFGELPVHNAEWPAWRDTLAWFDAHLRGRSNAVADLPAYRFFQLGENRWLQATQWPPAEAVAQRWHLSPGEASARSATGTGLLGPQLPPGERADTFRHDPLNPVPSVGGPLCCTGAADERSGPASQAEVEARQDVLVYTSTPLAQPLRIAGPLRAHLQVSSSAPDTDFIARLVHVFPDGRTLSLQEGAQRARWRGGYDQARWLRPGEVVALEVDMRAIAYTVPAGHRLRLHVASSSFPRLERNLGTGAANNARETRAVLAENTVHSGPLRASWLEFHALPPLVK